MKQQQRGMSFCWMLPRRWLLPHSAVACATFAEGQAETAALCLLPFEGTRRALLLSFSPALSFCISIVRPLSATSFLSSNAGRINYGCHVAAPLTAATLPKAKRSRPLGEFLTAHVLKWI